MTLGPETVARLAGLPHIAGIKDSSRDLDFHRRLLQATRGQDFAVFTGAGALLKPLHEEKLGRTSARVQEP